MLSNLKNVLVGVTHEVTEEDSFSALPYGLSLAQAAGAHLTVQAASVRVILTNAFVSDFAADLIAVENQRLSALALAAAEHSRGDADAAGVSCTTEADQLAYPDLVNTFTERARVHDLSILDAEPVAASLDRGLIEAVLTGSGRPIIVVPKGFDRFKADRVLVAWDGSARAARAVNDALPFLLAAKAVEVVTIEEDKDLSDTVRGAEIGRHLARHGIAVSVASHSSEGQDVAETLRRCATLYRADMIVIGGYVHSRLRELVLGGTTQSLLKACPVPLLLSH